MNQKGFANIVLIIVIVVLAGAVGYFALVRKSTPIAQQVSTPTPTQTTTGKIVDATQYIVDDFLKQNNSISPANVDFIKKITNYKESIDAWGKNLASIRIVKNEADENIIYFVDNGNDQSSKTADVYSLNLKTNILKEIYKSTPSIYYFHLIGRQDGKLLFQKIDQQDSPGFCHNNGWVYAYEHPLPRPKSKYPNQDDSRTIKSLDLDNPSVGFSAFTIPKEKYNSEVTKQETCQQEMKN